MFMNLVMCLVHGFVVLVIAVVTHPRIHPGMWAQEGEGGE